MLDVFEQAYKSSLETSRQVAVELNDYWSGIGISPVLATQLELCVVEMVNNTYIHAYSEQEGKPVKVKCNLNEDSETKTICIDIIDRGEPMTQTQLEKALSNEFVDMDPDDDTTWATSGRGFMIVSALMDDIKLRVKDGENCFMMTKELEETDLIENECPP